MKLDRGDAENAEVTQRVELLTDLEHFLFPLEILNRALVFLSSCAGFEGTQVLSLACLRIFLLRIQAVLTGLKFSNHLYSTVTDFARLRGWSTSHPRLTAM